MGIPQAILKSVAELNLKLSYEDQEGDIASLLERSVLLGGKRFRPLLTFLMSDYFLVPHENLAPYARGIELVHAASLSHDDVIDNATERRGNPSINLQGSNKMAVLAGDFLLADVIVELCRCGNFHW